MHEKVQAYLDAQKSAEQQKHKDTKSRTLLALDLYEKVYAPNNEQNSEYPHFEWDSEKHIGKYFKKVPIDITEEEYQEVLKYANKEDLPTEKSIQNKVATILFVIAWIIFVLGFVAGVIIGEKTNYEMALLCWVSAFLNGLSYLSLSQIIKLLHSINQK